MPKCCLLHLNLVTSTSPFSDRSHESTRAVFGFDRMGHQGSQLLRCPLRGGAPALRQLQGSWRSLAFAEAGGLWGKQGCEGSNKRTFGFIELRRCYILTCWFQRESITTGVVVKKVCLIAQIYIYIYIYIYIHIYIHIYFFWF